MPDSRLKIGILLPGFSADESDWAIPVQHNLIKALSAVEDVRILALRYPARREIYRVFDAEVHPLGYTHQTRGIKRFQLWAEALYRLHQLHQEKPFDVLHAMWADETGALAVWAGQMLKTPVVVSVLGGELARVKGYGLQHSAFSRWIVSQALKADKVLIACSYIKELLPYPAKTERLVMGVDARRFSPAPEKRTSHRLIHAASLLPVKDQATLLRAFARLPESFSLDIIGDGPERQNLETLARTLGISERVKFYGTVAYPDMPACFQRASLHVLSSLHEGLGMVTLEAAACDLATVSTNVGIVPDYPELGIRVPVGDDAAMAEAILQALERDFQPRKTILQSFTIPHTVKSLQRIYRGF